MLVGRVHGHDEELPGRVLHLDRAGSTMWETAAPTKPFSWTTGRTP